MSINLGNYKSAAGKAFGFSLLEMLTVVAIVGVITAIVVPQLAGMGGGETKELRFRRNAQQIASVYATAQAAGLDFLAAGNLEQTVRNVVTGGSPATGPFRTQFYAVKGLNNEDVAGVQRYLSLQGTLLTYSTVAH